MRALTSPPQSDEPGAPIGVHAAAAQVKPSQMQHAFWRSSAFEHLSAAGAILDETGRIVATNAAWRLFAALNGGAEGATGEGVNYLETCSRAAALGDDTAGSALVGLREILEEERTSFDLEYPCPSPDQDRWFLLQATAAPVVHGVGVVLFHVDITARKVLEQGLAHRANHDALTGLGNRVAARDAVCAHLASAGGPVVVVAFDLDGFKAVNDTFGHHAGDEVLVQVATRARRVFGTGGLVFRLGGDEFVAVCPDATTTDAELYAEGVREQMARPFQVGADAVTIGASAGIASSEDHPMAEVLLAEADARMYRDKRHRARVRCTEATSPATVLRARAERTEAPDMPGSMVDEELRAVQATTNAVLAHASDLVVFFAKDGHIVWASPASERIFGVGRRELIGRNGIDLVHPDDRERVETDFMRIPRRGDSVCTEFRLAEDGGSVRWVEEIATNLLDDPDVGAVVGHIRNVTDRKAAEDELRLQAGLLAAAGQAIVAQALDGTIVYWNRAAEELYGWTSAEAIGRTAQDLVPLADGWDDLAEDVRLLFEEGKPWSGEMIATTRSGRTVPVMVTGTPVVDATGRQTATIVVSRDISDLVTQRAQAEQDRQRLADAQASAGLGSFEIDLLTGEVTRSDELWRMIGRDPGTPGTDLFDSLHPDDRATVTAAFDSVIAGCESASVTHRIVQPNGEVRWVISQTSRASSRPHRLAGTTLDITERHLAELALAHQANHDPLTGLANRRFFVERLEASLDRNLATGRRTALLFIDLDDFKAVNDRIGHLGGDEVLRSVGELIDSVLTPGDTVARLGGDEYVVCCEGVADADEALEIVERIRRALTMPFRSRSEILKISASIGVAISRPASQAEALLRDADAAMYVAKQGRARVEVFDDAMNEQAARRRSLAAELADAITGGQIHTWFQPEVDLRTGRLVGFEALARWVHPERGLIGPVEFIELAEDTGLINELGRQVLADACCELARWNDSDPDRHLTVSVNLSAVQMASPGLAADVRSAVAAAGIAPDRLCLEVTETALMDGELAAEVLRSLKEIGVLIAIDDFGTGYSSLTRLKQFPVDFLKIDRSFVMGLGRDPEDELIVAAVISLAHSMGIQVIAEGIETSGQLAMLADMGCESGQGFLWGRPMPRAEALAYAAETRLRERVPPIGAPLPGRG